MPPTRLPPPLPSPGALVAHHIARAAGDLPTRIGVTYVWAGNGLFKHAWNGHTRALVHLAPWETPGLADLRPFVTWRGWPAPLPATPFNEALADAIARYTPEAPEERQWFAVLRGGVPVLLAPQQEAGSTRLSYEMPKDPILCDIHSHHGMPPFFSGTDNADDTWLGLSVVIGRLGSPYPSYVARINCYGDHSDVDLSSLVSGDLVVGSLPLVAEREARRHDRVGFPAGMTGPMGADEEDLMFADTEPDEGGRDEPATAADE
jgi:hypothetical protein